MTLTEMLDNKSCEISDRLLTPGDAGRVFKKWLKEVGLPQYYSYDRDGHSFNATESTRQLLVTLVDEP